MTTHHDRDEIIQSLADKIAAIDLTDQEAAILDLALHPEEEVEVDGHAWLRTFSTQRLVSSFQMATAKSAWCPVHGILRMVDCPHKVTGLPAD